MNVNVTSSECAWSHFEVQFLGRVIKGLRGFEFNKEVEKEHLYGAGNDALDIQTGNKKNTGSITVLGFEADLMNKAAADAGYDDITDVPHEAVVITCSFKKLKTDAIKTFVARGCAFTESKTSMKQNDKQREIQLPFLAMDIILPKA